MVADTNASARDSSLLGANNSLIINVPQPQSIAGLVPSSATIGKRSSTSTNTARIPTPLITGPQRGGTSTLQRRPCPPPPPSYAPPGYTPANAGIYHPLHLQTASRVQQHKVHEPSYGTSVSGRVGTSSNVVGAAAAGGSGLVPSQLMTTTGSPESGTSPSTGVVEFPKENLRFVERIGEGLFGEVGHNSL